jgi:flagellar assembly protein FliH
MMVLLKATEFAQSSGQKKAFNLNDIAVEAQAIIEDARREREKIMDQAQQEISQAREQAQTQGYQQGYDRGLAQGQKEGHEQALQQAQQSFTESSNDLLKTLHSVCEQFDQVKSKILWQAEQDTVTLAVAIARKVVKKIGLVSPDVTSENVKAALEMTTRNSNVVVKVNPKDIEHLEKMIADQQMPLGKYASITFEGDEAVTPGGCRLGTEQGEIDARLDTQIDRIANELSIDETPKENKNEAAQAEQFRPPEQTE